MNSYPHYALYKRLSDATCLSYLACFPLGLRGTKKACVCLKSLFLPSTEPLCTCLWRNCLPECRPCLLLVKFGTPSFHFRQKRKESEQEEKKTACQERFGADRQGAAGGALARLDVAKAAHLFSLSRKDPWNRIRRVCVKGQHWHTAGSSPPCVRGAPPPPLSGIIFCFRKEKKKKKRRGTRLIGPFIRGEGGLRVPRRCQTSRFLRDGNREKDLKWPGGRVGWGGRRGR